MKRKDFPALADLTQDIAGSIPVDLIGSWVESERDEATQAKLLEPMLRVGTVVSSDTAGLSKLSSTLGLIDIMRIVSAPKEIIYAYGGAIGGRGIGIWAADNTQMFYDAAVPAEQVVAQMAAAQKDIADGPVKVGMGIHACTCYEIGGGLYGLDADAIEELAESETEGGEIALSNATLLKLPEHFLHHTKAKPTTLPAFTLDWAWLNAAKTKSSNYSYPAPFNREFHERLRVPSETETAALHREYAKQLVVVLVRVFHAEAPLLLDRLSASIAVNAVIEPLAKSAELNLVKSNGTLGIFTTEQADAAMRFAETVRNELREEGYEANVGISRGDVLLFALSGGIHEIAGQPVNVASKLAEDTDLRGKVFVEKSVPCNTGEQFTVEKSHVAISGKII